jgi:hypothetical protein
MLDPRIYRTGLVAVALAVIVVAFSLQGQPGPSRATLAPEAFNGQFAYSKMSTLAKDYPDRRPGSDGDTALAQYVASALRRDQFVVSNDTFSGRTADGTRTLETVTATRTGLSNGSIVVVAHRDALSSPATASLSGTATLLDLGSVLSGETLRHTIVLASVSGSAGAAGATELARQLPGPIDAVIVLGDLAGTRVRQPVVVPWSNGTEIAPPLLRNTVATAVAGQAGLKSQNSSLGGQFAHLAFPLNTTEQAPFGARAAAAVLVSVSGERGPANGEQTSAARITGLGRAVLSAISALDTSSSVPRPSAYLLFSGKVIPEWAIKLFVLALILPVLGVAIDGLARASRRGHSLLAPVASVIAAGVPFALVGLAVLGAKLTKLLPVAPPGPVGPGEVPITTGDAALLVGLVAVLVLAFGIARWFVRQLVRPQQGATGLAGGATPVVVILLCAATIAIWAKNPFAAALVVPALHLWTWIIDPELRIHPLAALAMLLAGLALPLAVALYYALSLGSGPLGLAWTGVLMVAGGQIDIVAVLEWSIVLGCGLSVAAIALRTAREPEPGQLPVSVRGPVTYAGPGSLGGTESALRARR